MQDRDFRNQEMSLKKAQHNGDMMESEGEESAPGQIASAIENIALILNGIVDKLNAPKTITYDGSGRVVSIGDRQVIRGADGKVEMLN